MKMRRRTVESRLQVENNAAASGRRDAAEQAKRSCDYTTSTVPVHAAHGKIVGRVIGDVFVKVCEERKHMLLTPQAWSCDTVSLERARELGAKYVEIRTKDTRKVYQAPITLFWARGVRVERGHGEQLALPLSFWTVTTENEPTALQLQLFSEVA
jgi:hypothetical protein